MRSTNKAFIVYGLFLLSETFLLLKLRLKLKISRDAKLWTMLKSLKELYGKLCLLFISKLSSNNESLSYLSGALLVLEGKVNI